MGKFLKYLGCLLIGWNPNILAQCGEASIRQFYKLTSAMAIMIVLWGTIGFFFSQNYLNIETSEQETQVTSVLNDSTLSNKKDSIQAKQASEPIQELSKKQNQDEQLVPQTETNKGNNHNRLRDGLVSLLFIVIIVCIERVIILTVGKARFMTTLRVILAFVMATLGSTIIDQIIFRNDIAQEVKSIRNELIANEVNIRSIALNDQMILYTHELDSLNKEFLDVNQKYMENPTIKTRHTHQTKISAGSDSIGNAVEKIVTLAEDENVDNPIKNTLDLISRNIDADRKKINDLQDKQLNIVEIVTQEIQSRPQGFIEELYATKSVVGKSNLTMAFYFLMFLFFLLLETFVVSIKMADTKCDYDLIVEHQLKITELQLKANVEKLNNQYFTRQMPYKDHPAMNHKSDSNNKKDVPQEQEKL